jgi:hypothetical protein
LAIIPSGAPPGLISCNLTLPLTPVAVQVIGADFPRQSSPPLGEVILRLALKAMSRASAARAANNSVFFIFSISLFLK